jgi:hypothetical protein
VEVRKTGPLERLGVEVRKTGPLERLDVEVRKTGPLERLDVEVRKTGPLERPDVRLLRRTSPLLMLVFSLPLLLFSAVWQTQHRMNNVHNATASW